LINVDHNSSMNSGHNIVLLGNKKYKHSSSRGTVANRRVHSDHFHFTWSLRMWPRE